MSKPRIAVTLGDPAGIGPEIVRRAVNSLKVQRVCSPVVFGDSQSFKKYFKNVKNCELVESYRTKKIIKAGVPSKEGGEAALAAVERAIAGCLSEKAGLKALATAPVSKESLKLAGSKWPAHTEMLACLTESGKVAMMMVCGKICAVMATRHLPVKKVPEKIKAKDIAETVMLACEFLRKRTGKRIIKTVVCGLNPHAGDNGIIGKEEKKEIIPACLMLRRAGICVQGPFAADCAWMKIKNGEYDLICGMYHDQIMIPLKCIDAKKIVNVTAGLPFVRTSPGHGTAFDIAGGGKASPDAMIEAVVYAAESRP